MPSFGEHAGTLELWRRFPGLERLEPAGNRLALTFDDGPDAAGTPAVLDALDAADAHATFFVVGEQLERDPALGKELVASGHEVGAHGYSHPRHDELSADAAQADVDRGVEAVERELGTRPAYFRPPYGRFNEASHARCLELGLDPIYWSAWGLDWEPIPAERVVDLAARDIAAGAILVLHDSARYAPTDTAAPAAEAIGPICALAREVGLEPGRLSV